MNQAAEMASILQVDATFRAACPAISSSVDSGRHQRKPIRGNSRSGRNQCVIAGLLAKPEHGTGAGIPFVSRGTYQSLTSMFRDADGNVLEFDLEGLVETVVAVFRSHPHINNVLTHICGGQWERIGHALRVILNPLATLHDLSPLAQNIAELMSAERGVTGRILKPYFNTLLGKVLPPQLSAHLCRHVLCLFLEMQARDAPPIGSEESVTEGRDA